MMIKTAAFFSSILTLPAAALEQKLQIADNYIDIPLISKKQNGSPFLVPVAQLQIGRQLQTFNVILDTSFSGLILQSLEWCQDCTNESLYEPPIVYDSKKRHPENNAKPSPREFDWTNNGL